jgi:hypothetical protein
MTISKVHWDTEGENVRLSMPFSKVDSERRIVSGFATLDNVDKQADIVTTDASLKAFAKFRGNIREMHQPLSVGKMVSFKEDKYFDPESKKFFSGVTFLPMFQRVLRTLGKRFWMEPFLVFLSVAE